ncbi:hypothetical protein DIPPA_22253 [Diplonema papillatum]|nr:hypothetical protein DIPPA_22253 [Diplonema papillatum]
MAAAGETPAEAAVKKYRPFVHQLTTDAALLYCLYKEPPNPSGLDLWARALAVASLRFGTIAGPPLQ